MTRLERVALGLVLLVAAALRLTGLDWDAFQHHHPDERYIAWVATTIEFPSLERMSRADWQPATSTFNPFRWPFGASSEGIVVLQGEARDFAYGHVPLYMGVLATRLAERAGPVLRPLLPAGWSLTADVLNGAQRIEFHHLAAVGRALTALFDLGTVLFVFLLGRRLFGVRAALLAAALLALTVMHIQLAHFWTSDPYLTFFALAALWAMVAAHSGSDAWRLRYLLAAAALVGLAVGSKFTAVLLFVPLLWVVWTGKEARRWLDGVLALAVAGAVFALTNPFAILDHTCALPAAPAMVGPLRLPDALTQSCYLQNLAEQNAMASGRSDVGFTRQYADTPAYLYPVEMQIRWGMGPPLGLLAFAGLAWAIGRVAARLRPVRSGRNRATLLRADPIVIPLLWVLPYFIVTGAQTVKFMRYMEPITPLLVLLGAGMVWELRRRAARVALAGVVLFPTALYAIAFVALYGAEHPWNAASRWVYRNVPPGTMLLSEQWDDSLPVTMEVDGQLRARREYPNAELTWLSLPDAADDEAKLTANLEKLAAAEYLTVLSNRIYGVVPRLPQRYPLSSRYHQLLFNGQLGYELVWAGRRTPGLFGVTLAPDTFSWPGLRPPAALARLLPAGPSLSFGRADESFLVYDQPLTMIFRNTGGLSVAQMRAAFDASGR